MDLASERFRDDMSKAILDEMRRNHESTVIIFSKIVENRERKNLSEKEKVLSRELENRLFSQILLKAYGMSDGAQRLLESSRRESQITLKRMNVLTAIFVVAVMITTLVFSVSLNRLLRKRLETISKGAKIIGGGNLDYRIDLRSKDEFEDFSNEFNAMSNKLKKSFVSIEDLEKEITERKRAEEEREKLIHEIQDALAQIKKLSGLLPICASCKKIRDDKGYWNQLESYISDHSEAEFSHGICPDCMKKLYPDV